MNVGSIFELAKRTGLWVYCGVHREDDRVRKFLHLQQRTKDHRMDAKTFRCSRHRSDRPVQDGRGRALATLPAKERPTCAAKRERLT
jgi:hypothetical protein